jgi:ribosomal protein S18 acetylase RimI-like enzyme
MSVIRRIEASDVPQLFRVRAATDENRLTLDQLAGLGINEKSLREKLLSSHRGQLCEEQGSVVGFAIGDRSSGEMEVIAVLPTQICRGIGVPCWSRLKPSFSAKVVRRCGLRRTLTLGCEHAHSTKSTAGATGRLRTDCAI